MISGQKVATDRFRHLGSVIDSSFAIRHSSFSDRRAFTLIELIVTMTVIMILTGLVLSTVGYVQKKGARARAETEIAAMAAACENYKADNGIYPTNSDTQTLDPTNEFDPTTSPPNDYTRASLWLYKQLSGDATGNRQPTGKSYMTFAPKMLYPDDQTQAVQYVRDPFKNSYGYSTKMAVIGSGGYNPTFDLWSTAGGTTSNDVPKWIKNW